MRSFYFRIEEASRAIKALCERTNPFPRISSKNYPNGHKSRSKLRKRSQRLESGQTLYTIRLLCVFILEGCAGNPVSIDHILESWYSHLWVLGIRKFRSAVKIQVFANGFRWEKFALNSIGENWKKSIRNMTCFGKCRVEWTLDICM